MTKVPYQLNGNRARTTDRKSFSNFRMIASRAQDYSGIGMGVFDGFCAVDIDGCVANEQLTTMAEDIIATMDSYTEYSPSGTGIRILFKATGFPYDKARYYINNQKLGLEIYVAGATHKFVTLTGHALHERPIAERADALQAVLDRYMTKPVKAAPNTQQAPGSYLSDEAVIAKALASKQGEKFSKLWNGEVPDGKSASEADMMLCTMLAFWCGGDQEQMDRLFRLSALMRDKWDRDDYRTMTLENAVAVTTSFYEPITLSSAEQDFDDIQRVLGELDPVNNKRYRAGDLGFGRLFADMFKAIARYVPERKKWFVFDGTRWQVDIASLQVFEMSKNLADALIKYAITIEDEDTRKRYLGECIRWQSRRFRETYLKEAQSVYPIPMSEFDTDCNLLNCRNGTLELKGMTFRPHNPDDRLTKIIPVDYKPSAAYPRFIRFIDEIMSGDRETTRFLQKALGYAVSGDTRFECMFFLYGASTRNGKGTLMESILRIMGDYGRAVRPETIAQKQHANSQGPSEDIARLAGIRFANISEPSRGLVLNAAQVKSMTGNDTQNARFLNENSFDFQPQFKLYINANYLPVVHDLTLFTSERVFIIPFERHFEQHEQDKTLKEAFAKPEAQSAILNWLLEGYANLQKEGLNAPGTVLAATDAYQHESDKTQLFADECLEKLDAQEVKTADVYAAYRQWCHMNGYSPENTRNFNSTLRNIGQIARKRPSHGGEKTTILLGHRLTAEYRFLV